MPYMPVTSSMFLIAETREQPMHVGGLQLFIPREGQTAEELADEVQAAFTEKIEISEIFRRRPAQPFSVVGSLAWSTDDELDLDYHVRRIALPKPGRILELFRYVSLNHSTLLDRARPMWEAHIIEGLADGRLAVYTKIHHSLVDGVTALRLLERTLTADPDDRSGAAPWDVRLRRKKSPSTAEIDSLPPAPADESGGGLLDGLRKGLGAAADVAGQVAGIVPAVGQVAWKAVSDDDFVAPGTFAPRSMFDVPIGSARRFAADQWSISRMRAVAEQLGVTINDVVLAMCSSALRAYMIEHESLPDDPLIAMVPVSMHVGHDDDGNAVSAVMANLATNEPDPARRLETLVASMRASKNIIRGMRPLQALALGAATIAPLALATVPGWVSYTPPQFNLIISNVPGPREQMYWNGARLDGVYPVSIATSGNALNITLTSAADQIGFGLIGARAQLPSLQRMLDYLEDGLAELEAVAQVTDQRS
ncbi:wax ester synthase/diacylglycerol acyltransferase [Gordonia araii NBRC 100433]|uniref:Diacylglycerol O-acyltransferase n=1 Tax=Gordonia araii NBRC 100433 TaxID=1073574 RepID=G7H0X7_9ACTN|nr:wax ester/triacylglycerol synthase family O-acyltransferase [Gordonia araii]NNG97298.1 wax ester/triacylglycerol synthase family O-acyltransferase [Gordonia araii NBRC 100433]GAB09502.1 wax ester synthase/diacylglycerol acyltransferase [Gordonia araii NBRC 100433]